MVGDSTPYPAAQSALLPVLEPVSITLGAEERACLDGILQVYAECIGVVMPPSLHRREVLTAITRLRETLAVLGMQEYAAEGAGMTVDAFSCLTAQDAIAFFIATVPLTLSVSDTSAILEEATYLRRLLMP